MNNIERLKYVIASIFFSLALMVNAYAAAYVKYEGIEGESTDEKHDEWIDVLSVEVSQGKLIVTLNNGKKKWLKETGTYRFDDGRVFFISDGQVIKRGRSVPSTMGSQVPLPSRAIGSDPSLRGRMGINASDPLDEPKPPDEDDPKPPNN